MRAVFNCTTHLPVLCSVSAYPNKLYHSGGTLSLNFCALSTAKGMELIMRISPDTLMYMLGGYITGIYPYKFQYRVTYSILDTKRSPNPPLPARLPLSFIQRIAHSLN
jgi:hypothetical protein